MDKNFEPTIGQEIQTPEQYFAALKKRMEEETPKGRPLTVEEERQMQDGFAIEEMMHSAGWSIVSDILQNMPKAHVDPRGMKDEEWKFAELNAFWQGAVAKELLDGLYGLIQQSHELQRIKLGEVQEVQKMRM